MEDKKKVEAVLFTTGRFMDLEEISKACGIGSIGYIKELIEQLKKDYSEKDSALMIQELDNKYKLNIKKEYGSITNKLISTKELDSPTTKTLAIIAYKQPVLQSIVIKIRGNKAYDHINILKEQGLILSEKSGRTRMLKLTPKFYDYFDIDDKLLKETLNQIKLKDE
ncbi:MAG: SMC-Scp complex subunit ScpB [Candidatus Woesearchaeota archaeon]|nr:SMC-Scp complex subunit ScpB [Candidatus Woesearchaeota archaeon]